MARRGRTVIPEEDTELNMTPMLDVVFILLIFFIVTSVFVKTPGIDPSQPDAVLDATVKPTILVAVKVLKSIQRLRTLKLLSARRKSTKSKK